MTTFLAEADRTNGRSYATVLRPTPSSSSSSSVTFVMYCG